MQRFSGSSNEWQILEALCGEWNFWSVSEVFTALQKGNHEIFYVRGSTETELWPGLLIAFYSPKGADIVYLYVREAHRSRGLGMQLLQELQHFLVEKQINGSLVAEVRASNASAIKLYERFGMSSMSKRPNYYSNDEDALVYRKKIVFPVQHGE